MSTTLIQQNLWKKLQSKKYRHSFVGSQIGASVAAQIASTRVARGWTQSKLAKHAKMSQVRISVLEDPSYENFSIKTLKRLAQALDVALIVRFAPFSEMLGWLSTVRPDALAVARFSEDAIPGELERTALKEEWSKYLAPEGQRTVTMAATSAVGNSVWSQRESVPLALFETTHHTPAAFRQAMVGSIGESSMKLIGTELGRAVWQREQSALSQLPTGQDRRALSKLELTLQTAAGL